MPNNPASPGLYPLPVPSGRYPLQVAAQLYYARLNLDKERTSEQAYELARKFERVFGEAWECVPRASRAHMLTYWEQYPRYVGESHRRAQNSALILAKEPQPENQVRRATPYEFPNIGLVNLWFHSNPNRGLCLGRVTREGTDIRFWAPAVEDIPEEVLVCVILDQLAQVAVYAHGHASGEVMSADEKHKRVQADSLLREWNVSNTAFLEWREGTGGRNFKSKWESRFAFDALLES